MRTTIWLVGVAVVGIFAGPVRAATVTTWNGGSGSWTTGSNWSGGVAPSGAFDVRIDGGNGVGSVVSLGTATTIEALTLDAGDTLNLTSGLTVNSGGTINGSVNTSAVFNPGLNQTVSGNGTFTLSSVGAGLLVPLVNTSLTLGSGITVQGFGTLGVNGTFTNNGHLIANQPFSMLRVHGLDLVNNGTVEATNGGTILIDGTMTTASLGNVVNNGGTLKIGYAIGATLVDNTNATFTNTATTNWTFGPNATIKGGVVDSVAGHDFLLKDHVTSGFDGVTLSGRVAVTDESLLDVSNGLVGSGTITLATQGAVADLSSPQPLEISSGIAIRGTGTVGDSDGGSLIHGTLDANVVGKTIQLGGTAVCDGTIQIRQNCRVAGPSGFNTALEFDDGGHLFVELGSASLAALAVQSLDLTSSEDYLDLVKLSAGNGPFLVATYTSLNGTFNHVTDGFTVDYSTPGKIFVTAVPEPGVGMVVVAGAGLLRRRPRAAACG